MNTEHRLEKLPIFDGFKNKLNFSRKEANGMEFERNVRKHFEEV